MTSVGLKFKLAQPWTLPENQSPFIYRTTDEQSSGSLTNAAIYS